MRFELGRIMRPAGRNGRRGAFLVLAFFSLVGALGFVALSVDLGVIALTKTRMQNAVDAAALAAAQEITAAVVDVGENVDGSGDVGDQVSDANAIAVTSARQMAAHVGELNDVYIDAGQDVKFGKRIYNEGTGGFDIQWGIGPYNVVGVTARRDNATSGQPDSMLELFFAPFMGNERVALSAEAFAFVEARDLVMVLDYSGSMNDDSELRSIDKLGQPAIEENLNKIWEDLDFVTHGNMGFVPDWVTIPGQPASGEIPHVDVTWRGAAVDIVSTKDLSNVVLEFSNGTHYKFDELNQGETGTFQGTGDNSGKLVHKVWVKSGTNDSGDGPGYGEKFDFFDNTMVKKGLGLDSLAYPYESGSWDNYVDYARDSTGSTSWYDGDVYDAGYRRKFGMLTLINFWLKNKPRFSQTSDLWKTREYPFHSMKEGATLLLDFLDGLQFGDHVGLATYDSSARVETELDEPSIPETVNLGDEWITDDYDAIDTIQRHKQAGHYEVYTNIGDGIKQAKELLDSHGRYGARPTILLMTDGNANRHDELWSLPDSWSWSDLTDYDGDGGADYTTGDVNKLYAFGMAKEAIDAGYTIHTMSVGVNADRDLMQAIAFASGGTWIDVPGGSTVQEMESQLLAAFSKIAANVPPAKLLNDNSE